MTPAHARLRRTTALIAAVLFALPASAVAQTLEQVEEERRELEAEIADVVEAYEDITERLETARDELGDLESRTAELEAEMAEVNEVLERRARLAFISRDGSSIGVILGANGPGGAIERAAYLNAITVRERGQLEGASNLRVQLEQTRDLLADKEAEFAALEEETQQLLDQLNATLSETKEQESELRTRRERQQFITNGVLNGTYACIIAPPYHFRDTWGAPRSGGRRHKGTDVFGRWNAQVYAFTHGRISRISSSRLGGLGVYLKGDDGNVYYYAHLNGIAPGIGTGSRVEAGQLIAYNGDSGNARGGSPHIHYQIHPGGGGPVNPYPWLAPACF